MKTHLASEIDTVSRLASYDRCCKNLLVHKVILAHILKECVWEFNDYSIDYIEKNCIEGTPQVAEVPVHRNVAQTEKIIGANTEDSTIDEGVVYFDIRFVAVLPKTGEQVRLIINLEAQNKYNPGYALVRRGLYYCCRLISAQYETEFTKDNYDDIKKVYSIWICTDVPDYAKNTVTRYKITEENIVGNLKNDFQKYDLINVIMVCLDKDKEEVGNDSKGILKLLRVLLSDKMMAGKKKNILSSDFDIAMNVEIEEEMSRMCNLSEGVLERGRIEGRAEGRAEGRVEGRAEGRVEGRAEGRVEGRTEGQEMANVESLKNIMEGFSVTFEKAAETLKIPVNEWEKYRSKLL